MRPTVSCCSAAVKMTGDLDDLVVAILAGAFSGGGQSAVISGSVMKRFHSSMSSIEFGNKETYGPSGALMKNKRERAE